MKIAQKIGSLLRRHVPFFCLAYNWDTKQLLIYRTTEEYMAELGKLRDMGMCKRCQCVLEAGFTIFDLKYDVRLVSFGDIRAHRCVFGENPISKEFGVCMFDYVFLFLTKKDAHAEQQSAQGSKYALENKERYDEISLQPKEA